MIKTDKITRHLLQRCDVKSISHRDYTVHGTDTFETRTLNSAMNTGIMEPAIFWLSLLLLMTSSVEVFARPIDIDRDLLGKPLWIMSKAGDKMPNEYGTQLFNNSFDENNIKIRPFINWRGVLKMVVPIPRSSEIKSDTQGVVPDVYNWDTLPCFRNSRVSRNWIGSDKNCDGDNVLDEYDDYKTIIVTCGIITFFVLCVILCSFLKFEHHPDCYHLKGSSVSSSAVFCSTCSSLSSDQKHDEIVRSV